MPTSRLRHRPPTRRDDAAGTVVAPMSDIVHIAGREILDSRGNPTVEVEVVLSSGRARAGPRCRAARRPASTKRSSSATAASATSARACSTAVGFVNDEIAGVLDGFDALDQRTIDRELIELDGTDNKARIGANAILGTTLAVAKAAADELELPLYRYVGGPNAHVLPVPMMNVLNGGVHADNTIDLQEFMIMPVGAPSFSRGVAMGHRDLPHAQEGAARQGPVDRGRRRGRVRARPRHQRGRHQDPRRRRSSRPASRPATTSRSPSTRR